MDRVGELRAKAAQCVRLSKGVSNPADVAQIEAYAAELDQAAAAIEEAEAAV